MDKYDSQTRGRILCAALKHFANWMMTIKVMERLVHGKPRLQRHDAESIVQLFLGGAAVPR